MRIKDQSHNRAALKAIQVSTSCLTKTKHGWLLPENLEPAFLAAREEIIQKEKAKWWEDNAEEVALDERKDELRDEAEESGLVEGEDFMITWDGRFVLLGENGD